METLLGWDIIGWIIAFLVPGGVAVMALNESRVAKVCFALSSLVLAIKVIMWGITTKQPFYIRGVITAACFAVIGIFLIESYRWVDRKKPGTVPYASLEGPTFKEKVELVRISMGTNGQTIGTPFDRLLSGPLNVYSYGRNPVYNLVVMSMDQYRLYVDVKLAVPPMTSPLEIKHNEFVVQPPGWDKNSNKAALEFVDERQEPVFQMIYLNNYHVQLNGIIALPESFLIADKTGFRMLGRRLVVGQVRAEMDRIFRYPSWKYPGEFETHPPEHPPAPEKPRQPESATQVPPVAPSHSATGKETNKRMHDDIPKVPPGSIVSINQSGGITAGQVNITGTAPVKVEFAMVSGNVAEDTLEGKVYRSTIRITLNGLVPRFSVSVSASSLISLRINPEAGGVMKELRWPVENGRGGAGVQEASGTYLLYIRSKTPEKFDLGYQCEGVQCIGPNEGSWLGTPPTHF